MIEDMYCVHCDIKNCSPHEIFGLLWTEISTGLLIATPSYLRAEEAESRVFEELYPKYQEYLGEKWIKEINMAFLLKKFPIKE